MEQVREIFARIRNRKPDSHKGDYGHVLILAGSIGYTGAPYLASMAALVSGSGLVTLGVGKSLHVIMASKLVEVMVKPFYETKEMSLGLLAERDIVSFAQKIDCIAVGPGITRNKETQQLVRNIISKIKKPFVVDADGVIAIAGHLDVLRKAETPVVLTPHPGEMAALVKKDVAEIQGHRREIAQEFAREHHCVVVLKGHGTIVADPVKDCYCNTTGNPGMASGGTGDVLTGMIASFIGQGLDGYEASVLGVYLHGLAGDLAAKIKGEHSLIATDLLHQLPDAFKTLA